jgi:hypothetical protein
MSPLTATDPSVTAFLNAWHESERAYFEQHYSALVYDRDAPKTAKERRKYIALDNGTSGVYLVDKATGDVYSIKAYGVPNRRLGSLADLTARYRDAQTAARRA